VVTPFYADLDHVKVSETTNSSRINYKEATPKSSVNLSGKLPQKRGAGDPKP